MTEVAMPKRVVFVKNKGKTYVYLTKGVHYDNQLKKSLPDRVAIGKQSDSGNLIPNKKYYEIFGFPLLEQPSRSDTVSVGSKIVVDKIARDLQLKALLESIFGDITPKLLDIATFMLIDETSAMTRFEDYAWNHCLFNGSIFTDGTISNLFAKLTTFNIDLFLSAWVKIHCNKKIYIAYDSTNMNSTASNLELIEYGKAKDNSDLPQVNVSIGYNQTDSRPLFYEIYPGSIIDNSECEKMVERAQRYGCKDVAFVLDRGYFSINNIRFFESKKYDYILMTKGSSRFLKDVMKNYAATLRVNNSYFISKYELYGMTKEINLFGTDSSQYVHIFYDGINGEKQRIEINKRYENDEKKLEELLGRKITRKEDVTHFSKHYNLSFDDNGFFVRCSRKTKAFEDAISSCGFFVIITSTEMSASEAIEIYRNRDAIEKMFRMEKSSLDNYVFRVHSDQRMEGKMFVTFLALILLTEIRNTISPLYKLHRSDNTVPKVISTIDHLSVTKLSDNQYHQRYKLTAAQKRILKLFGIDENEYKNEVTKIAKELEQESVAV